MKLSISNSGYVGVLLTLRTVTADLITVRTVSEQRLNANKTS